MMVLVIIFFCISLNFGDNLKIPNATMGSGWAPNWKVMSSPLITAVVVTLIGVGLGLVYSSVLTFR